MNYHVYSELQQISQLREQWNAVSLNRPFLSWEWHHSWYRHFSEAKKPLVVMETTAGQNPSWIAPLYLQTSSLGTNKAGFAGDGNVCTDHSQIVTIPGQHSYSISKFVRWLNTANQSGATFDFVDLDGLSIDSELTRDLINQLTDVGFVPEIQPLENCWVVRMPDSWDSLNASFSRKHRRKTRKATANLHECEILDCRSHDFGILWSHLVELHQARRQSLGEPGCFVDARFCGFLKEAVEGLLQRGLAEILVIKKRGKSLAATLLFNDDSTTFMYQTGFDPDFSGLEPGYMLIVAAMKRAIEAGHQHFDFMRGDEPYKARWNSQPDRMVRLHVRMNDKLRVRLCDRVRWSKQIVKSSLEKFNLLPTPN